MDPPQQGPPHQYHINKSCTSHPEAAPGSDCARLAPKQGPPTLILSLCTLMGRVAQHPASSKPTAKAPPTPAASAVDIKCFIFNIKNQYF